MPIYTVVSTSYCRARKGLFRRGPLRKQNRRAVTITSPNKKEAIKAYKLVTPVAAGCKLKIHASLKVKARR